MRRFVIDTNIYIDWFNTGRHEDVLFQRDTVKHLSAVVLMELRAGAFSPSDRRLVQRVQSAFEKAGRIEASHSIVNDLLIALSARSIGAAVVTQNERDYQAIQAVRPFQLIVVR